MAQDTNRSPPKRGRKSTPPSPVSAATLAAADEQPERAPAPLATSLPEQVQQSPPAESPDRVAADDARAVIPVVGIGASAGGLDAISRFLAAVPVDSGAAFVVILHLDPTHESHLVPLLARHTAMPVVEIVDGMTIEANRVHVIVPDRSVTVSGDRLLLSEPIEPRGHRRLVDAFFTSLALERGERAIGIVLSGTGANGTRGLKEIKAQGGMTIAQDPDTAAFGGMPRSAIAAGAIDHIVAIESMPASVLSFIRHEYIAGDDASGPNGQTALDPLLALLLGAGHDFRGYKRGTVLRRIQRRMGLSNQASLATYADLLRGNPAELRALVKDMMITVTSFFRDPEAWAALDDQVIAPLVAERESGGELRFWVPACASGEEAYSLVMLATERAEAAGKRFDMKVFATDSQEDNLAAARAGVYPEAATANLSPARLERFFEMIDGSYQIKKEFRERVVFAPQNLLRDPPFSRLDLVTCRNLLIYLEPAAQKRILALFHFALRDGGYLFLGSAETVGAVDELFETRSKKWRIYRGIGSTPHNLVNFPVLRLVNRRAELAPATALIPIREESPQTRIADVARRALIDRYAPASVLTDAKGRVLYFHGPTGDFLEPPSGEPTRDLVLLARDGLRAKLRGAMRKALEKGETIVFTARLRHGTATQLVSATVAPLIETQPPAALLLVSFARLVKPTPQSIRIVAEEETPSERAMELELKAARIELQGTIEQAETANEELKSANEEVTSMNEELQSTNEELETSKEELQSFNEELHTTNHQLQYKIHELEGMTDDLNNLLAGSRIASVFLDAERRIKWFSPASQELFDLVATDIGRPLGHFALKFSDPALLSDAETVLATLEGRDAEVRSDSGRWYLRKLLPYRMRDNRIGGLVITFGDISELKRASDAVEEERIYCQAIVETIGQPLLVLDSDLRIRSANRAFYALFVTVPAATEGRLLFELGAGHWDIPDLRTVLQASHSSDGIGSVTVDREFDGLGRRAMVVTTRRLARGGERPELILLAIDDVTARNDAEQHRDLLVGELRHRVKNTLATVQALAWQTSRNSKSLADFEKAFAERLQALAQVHDLLVEEGWLGADIDELVHRTLEPYRVGNPTRIVIEGPRVAVTPATGVALVMVIQELVTNATKYGGLSVPTGSVRLTWQIERGIGESQIHLRWTEAGGPPVVEPTRRGFGTTFVERASMHELHGKATLQFRPAGLRCDIIFPKNEPVRHSSSLSPPDSL